MPASPGRGRLIDQPTDVLRETLEADLLPHLSAARHLIPLLAETKRGGSYVLIGGPGSEAAWLNYGCRSVAAAALRMLANVLHDEAQSLDVRVQMLLVETPLRGETCVASQCPRMAERRRRRQTGAATDRSRASAAKPAAPGRALCTARRARRRWRRIRGRRDDYQTVSVSGRPYVPEDPDLR